MCQECYFFVVKYTNLYLKSPDPPDNWQPSGSHSVSFSIGVIQNIFLNGVKLNQLRSFERQKARLFMLTNPSVEGLTEKDYHCSVVVQRDSEMGVVRQTEGDSNSETDREQGVGCCCMLYACSEHNPPPSRVNQTAIHAQSC